MSNPATKKASNGTQVAGTKPSLARILVGNDAAYCVASEAGDHGFVTKVSVR